MGRFLDRMLSATNRAQQFFINTPFFNHFIELCVVSYPSALEERAPSLTKVVLLIVAGFFEYIAASFLADLVDLYIELCQSWFRKGFTDIVDDRRYEKIVLLLLAWRFTYRGRSFFRRPLTNAGRIGLFGYVVKSFWYNPGLVYHVTLKFASRFVSFIPLRWGPLYLFWCLMAPSSETPIFVNASWLRTEAGREKLKETSKPNLSFKYIAYSTITTVVLEKIVTDLPMVTIQITLFAQSLVFYSSTWAKPEIPPVGISEILWSALPTTVVLALCKLYHCLENITFDAAELVYVAFFSSAKGLSSLRDKIIRAYKDSRSSSKGEITKRETPPASSIRLLEVFPSIAEDEPIRCELQWHDINDVPKYTAISYTWGRSSHKCPLIMNGKLNHTTASAGEVLRMLRSRWKTETLWIDAICIEQDNNDDKTQQIPLMPRIYENAAEIVIWLGKSKRAILATELVNRAFLTNRLSASSRMSFTYQIPKDAARALKRMLTRAWFERAWIVQEVVRRREDKVVNVRYGDESLSWQRLSWFTDSISRDPTLLAMLSERIGYSGLDQAIALRNASIIRRFSFLRAADEEPLSLVFYLVQMYRSSSRFKATVEHDRVYALLGLSRSANPHFVPDYNKSLRQLYIDIVENAVKTNALEFKLDFLAHAGIGYNSRTPSLPSWVPDWSSKPVTQNLFGTEGGPELLKSAQITALLKDTAALASFAQYNPILAEATFREVALSNTQKIRDELIVMLPNASPHTEPSIKFLPDDLLRIRGCKIDTLRTIGRTFTKYNPDKIKDSLAILAEWSIIAKDHFKPSMYSGTAIWEIFLRTLFTDRQDSGPLDFTFTANPLKLQDDLVAPFAAVPLDLVFQRTARPVASAVQESAEAVKLFQTLVGMLAPMCTGRVFGITEKGRMGLFLPGSKRGDEVVLLYGARVPFNVQLVEGGGVDGSVYDLVGPAYVHGVMYGEELLCDPASRDFILR